MDSKDLYKELEKDNAAQIILALSKLYNQLRQQRLVKWVEAIRNTGTCSVILLPRKRPEALRPKSPSR